MTDKINIIIPIGGIGERFKNENYYKPKPLINVLGKPIIYWLLDNLKISGSDTIYIPYQSELKSFMFEEYISNRYPNMNIKFIVIDKKTRGACETIDIVLNSDIDLSLPIVSLDCDTFFYEDIIGEFKKVRGNAIFYHLDYQNKPIFSYIKIDCNVVTQIEEKNKISDNANIGSYGFTSGYLLKEHINNVLNNGVNEEKYLSLVYKSMINGGERISPILVKDFNCLGTPNQIKIFANNNLAKIKNNRFCFDLDNTLVTAPKIAGDYSSVDPINRNINYLRFLKNNGGYIIIQTARRMRTHNSNVGKVIQDIGEITIESLKKFDIPYDEIYFGKPYANFYIDDLAINCLSDLEKETGFYDINVPARSFNKIEFVDEHVIKTTNNKCELFWYENIPENIKHIFPNFSRLGENTFKLEKINGVCLTHLYRKQDLNKTILLDLLNTLDKIHSSKPTIIDKSVLNFYRDKLISRTIDTENNELKTLLEVKIKQYVDKHDGVLHVIHGDPVLTNVFITDNGFKFIDMRGSFGTSCSIYGDVKYDYAKVYQSILGYDSILLGEKVDENYSKFLENVFINEIKKKFNDEEINDIKMLTSYLYLTLTPLHENKVNVSKFIEMSKKIIE